MPVTPAVPSRRTLILLALIVLAAGVTLMHAGRGLTFFYDDWDFVLRRRGVSPHVLLDGHNGHLSIVPVVLWKAMLQVFGLGSYWPYRLLLVVIHLTACVLLFWLLRLRVGDVIALCATAVLGVLGFAADDLIWAFQIGFVGSAAAGMGMLVALDRRSVRGDVVAAALLAVALGSSSIGVPFLVVAIVQIAAERDARRFGRVVLVPLVLYAAWRLGYGESDLKAANIDAAPAYAFNMLAAAVGGLTGIGGPVGSTLALGGIGALLWGVVKRAPSPRLLGLLAGALALWALTALARAGLADPQSARYAYASAVLILLMAAELWPLGVIAAGRAAPVAVAIAAVAVVGNLQPLNARAKEIRGWSGVIRADLTAVEIAGARTPASFTPVPVYSPQILAGQYLSARGAFGGNGYSEAELEQRPSYDRHTVDEELAQIVPPTAVAAPNATHHCDGAVPEFQLPREGAVVIRDVADGRPVRLHVRRYGQAPTTNPIAQLADGQAVTVTATADRGTRPWTLVGSAPIAVCH